MGVIPGLPAGACVLPRTRLLFTRLELAAIPPRRRREAVLLELEQKAPFEDPAGWMLSLGDRVAVWYWPRELEEQAQPGGDGERLTAVPETALWPPLAANEYRRVERPADHLYLLQYVHPRQGLYEKRYAAPPDEAEVLAWLRRHGAPVEPGGAPPARQPPPAYDRPPAGESLNPQNTFAEQQLFPALAALLVFLLLVYSVAATRAWWEADRARERRQALQAEVQEVITLRNRAAELRAGNRQLADLARPPQLTLAALLAETLDVSDTELRRWNYRGGRLELSWRHPDTPPEATELITRLEAKPALRNVQAQVHDEGIVQISLEVNDAALREDTASQEAQPPAAPETGADA